jgi:hypothetical protein
VVFTAVLALFAGMAGAQMAGETREAKSVFSFLEKLHTARAHRETEQVPLDGEWNEGRFRFTGLASAYDILVSNTAAVDGKTRPAIWFQPVSGYDSTLTFSRVPAGRRLVVSFALPDASLQGEIVTPVLFEVWIGNKKLLETTLTSKGWSEKRIDLTVPYFLQRRYNIQFRVRAAGEQPSGFLFHGRVE